MTYIGDLLAPNLSAALNTERCAATLGCIPYEVFTYQGVTAEQAAFLGGTAIQTTNTSMSVFNAYVTGDTGWGLAAGNIITVFGYEWRENIYERISDSLFEQGALLGQGGATPSIDGGYNVNELFTEANIPLLPAMIQTASGRLPADGVTMGRLNMKEQLTRSPMTTWGLKTTLI